MPNWVPPLKGLADFKGRVIHAHSFRDAQDFKGQRLLLIGNGYSGEDIAMQCVKFGAARATIGFRTAAAGHDFQDWPIVERKLPTHYDRASGEFKFEDGDGLEVDCVIYCTGYRHTFPFLDEPLQLRTPNRLAPDTLWKGMVHPDCTSLYFVGMPDQYYTFTMFDAQARFVLGCLQGRVAFPTREGPALATRPRTPSRPTGPRDAGSSPPRPPWLPPLPRRRQTDADPLKNPHS